MPLQQQQQQPSSWRQITLTSNAPTPDLYSQLYILLKKAADDAVHMVLAILLSIANNIRLVLREDAAYTYYLLAAESDNRLFNSVHQFSSMRSYHHTTCHCWLLKTTFHLLSISPSGRKCRFLTSLWQVFDWIMEFSHTIKVLKQQGRIRHSELL